MIVTNLFLLTEGPPWRTRDIHLLSAEVGQTEQVHNDSSPLWLRISPVSMLKADQASVLHLSPTSLNKNGSKIKKAGYMNKSRDGLIK